MMSSYYDGNLSPSWVRSRRNRPSGYNKIYDELKEFNGSVKTDKVTKLLQKSGLQSQQLDRIWNLINKKSSSLSEQDFCILLAFVALSQKGTHVFDIKTLFKLVQPPPVPDFNKPIPTVHENPAVFTQPKGYSHIHMHSFTKESQPQPTDSSMDDEFSDFQSGLTSTSMPTTSKTPDIFSASAYVSPDIDRPSVTSPLPQKPIPFSPIHVHGKASHGHGLESEVGSRLANYNLGYSSTNNENGRFETSTHCAMDNLIGEEDKYSVFRVLVDDKPDEPVIPAQEALPQVPNHRPISKDSERKDAFSSSNDSDFGDFGDFQSFTDTNSVAEPLSRYSLIDAPVVTIPIPPTSNSTNPFTFSLNSNATNTNIPNIPVRIKPTEPVNLGSIQSQNEGEFDDFGEFVSFTAKPSVPESSAHKATPISTPVSVPLPNILPSPDPVKRIPSSSKQTNLLDQELINTIDLTKYEFTVPSETSDPNSPSPNLKSRFGSNTSNSRSLSFSFDVTSPSPPPTFNKFPLKTTKIGNNNNLSLLDPFEEFTSFESSSPENGNGNHGGGIGLDHSLGQSLSTSGGYEIKLKQSSPETLSVCSLDLGNYGGNWEMTEGQSQNHKSEQNVDSEFMQQASKASNLFMAPDGNDNDKYNCFKEELEVTKARCTTAWKRCMRVCVRLIENAGTIFNSVSSSDIIRQLISTEKGKHYVLGLREVYLVACRVYHSWMKLSADDSAGHLHQKLAVAWDSFAPFLVGTSLEYNVNQDCVISEDELSDSNNVCGICLIGTKRIDNFDDDAMSLLLDYGGSLYHLACANLWVNEIDAVLPSLYK